MKIYDIIDNMLKKLDVPFYDTMPDFSDKEMPELFIVYNIYDVPQAYGDGQLCALKYVITINILGTNVKSVDNLQKSVFLITGNADLHYAGCTYQIDDDFPKYSRRILDFNYTLCLERED